MKYFPLRKITVNFFFFGNINHWIVWVDEKSAEITASSEKEKEKVFHWYN